MTIERGLSSSVIQQTTEYYRESPGYLLGPLQGTCHFGLTPENEMFDLETALRNMEHLMGQKLALPSGSRVLDAGCGFGRVARTLRSAPYNLNVVGIDLILERLKEAQVFNSREEEGGFFPINGSYSELPLPDSSVDGIVTMETLCHAPSLYDTLDEFWRVLQPGGKLVLFEYTIPDTSSLDPIRRAITDNMISRTGMASIHHFTHDAFPEIMQRANFENITVEDISRKVWPTWKFLFQRAVREDWKNLLTGQMMSDVNSAASFMIYPYRHHLGYKTVTATKPLR